MPASAVYRSADAPDGQSARKLLLLDVSNDVRVDDTFWIICQNFPDSEACQLPE